MNPQHEPLGPEERALARLLADATSAEPSPETDARILAAARAATRPAVPATVSSRRRRTRWPVAIGLAASVTFAVGVAWQLREPPLPAAAPAAFPVADEPSQVEPATSLLSPGADDDATAPAPAVAAKSAAAPVDAAGAGIAARSDPAQEHRAAVAAATGRSAQRQEKAIRQADVQAAAEAEQARTREAAIAAATQRSVQRGEKAARQAAAVPAAAPPPPPLPPMRDLAEPRPTDVYRELSPPMPPAPVADADARAEAPAEIAAPRPADVRSAPAPLAAHVSAEPAEAAYASDATAIEADARLPAAQWLQRIRERRDQGEVEAARASLARFIRAHPAQRVPDDLLPLMP